MKIKIDQAIRLFKEKWNERTGDRSAFSRQQSPFVRAGLLRIRDLPVELVDTLLGSISYRAAAPLSPDAQPPRRQRSGWYYILPVSVYGIIAALLPIPGWVSTLVILLLTACSVWLFLKFREKPNASDRKPVESEVSGTVEMEEAVLSSILKMAEDMLTSEADYLCEIEKDAQQGHDITKDGYFGQWVQKFSAYVNQRSEDQNIRMLYGELIGKLQSMDITVYDQLLLDENGLPAVPDRTYYVDEREGDTFTQVKHPVVYSGRQLLARGTLK